MVKRIRIIGIGMGNPAHLTREAVDALNTVDVFLVANKGETKVDLSLARQAICAELIEPAHRYRLVEVTDPQRGPDRERDSAAYGQGVRDWHLARFDAYSATLEALADEEETVGFLVWGDPAFYDSTIRIVDVLRERFDVEVDVIPGISAPQLLAARHRIPLNRIGAPIHITTGRRLVDEYSPALGDVVVMLDGDLRCAELVDVHPDLELFWGADLGGPDEVLVAGRLADVIDDVRRARAELRERRGWVMDTYLLRPAAGERTALPPAEPVWPAVTELSDGVLALRPMTADDWAVLHADATNEESERWSLFSEPMSQAQARATAAAAPREWRVGPRAAFVMVDVETGQPAGTIKVSRQGPPGVALIGYGVLPEWRGRAYTGRALELLAEWVFSETSINRLELGHKVDNVASGKAAMKAGWAREGQLARRLRNADGTYSDEFYYGRVRPLD
jgi:precorrin-6A synthase (deacetylating)